MRILLSSLLFTLLFLTAGAQGPFLEAGIESGMDDADERGNVVSLVDVSLNAGSAFGVPSYMAVRFRNVELGQNTFYYDAHLRFIVSADSIDSVALSIGLEAKISPANYSADSGNLSARQLHGPRVTWVVQNAKKGDTITTPDLSSMMVQQTNIQLWGAVFSDLSFVIGPADTNYASDVAELAVFSTNQTSQLRSPRLFLTQLPFVGIEESFGEHVTVFPNPVRETLQLQGLPTGDYSVRIVSLQGQEVLHASGNTSQVSMDVSSLRAGHYLLILANDEATETRPIIIQR